jgi:glutamyl-tRNA synthetase
LILRNEDLDAARCRSEFATAIVEDLRWFGFAWDEGPDTGGPCEPYAQSARTALYRDAFQQLARRGLVYPCTCSRRDIEQALQAPHPADDEPVYPGRCRPPGGPAHSNRAASWRFRVPDGEPIHFLDGGQGPQVFVAGRDFGDFIVWRHDDVPAYQLAVVVDDALMGMTEVVRGVDLLVSTARQLLLYRALGFAAPRFFHCALMVDASGCRLAKRHASLSLRELRDRGCTPEELRGWPQWTSQTGDAGGDATNPPAG